nr:hypothetical protein [Tanacetum cinerariifolium]
MAEGLSARILMENRDAHKCEADPQQGGSEGLLDRDLICWRFPWHILILYYDQDPILRLCNRLIACSIVGRSQGPKKAPPPPPSPADARTMPQRMARLEEDVHEIRGALTKQREVIDAMARDFSRFFTWTTTSLARMMDRAGSHIFAYISWYDVLICLCIIESSLADLIKEISTNIGGEFKYLEILKCWSLETSRRLFNT